MNGFISFVRVFLIKSWRFVTGVVFSSVVFFSAFYDFKTSHLDMEITSISNGNDEPVDLIKENGLPVIKSIFSLSPTRNRIDFFGDYGRYIVSQDDISRRILLLKSQRNEQERNLKELEEKYYRARNTADQNAKISLLKDLVKNSLYSYRSAASTAASLSRLIMDVDGLEEKSTNADESDIYYVNIIENYIKREKDELIEKEEQLNQVELEWGQYIKNTLPKRARLTVSVAIGNSGDGATSLKPQALFRADLGGGNYLDFPMKLKGYERANIDNASFQPKTYKVVRFESEEVGAMVEADRERFKMFLGNASPATLFVSDVRGNTYYSNAVPFSPGVYEQKAYDLLKKFASDLYTNKS